MKKFLIVTLLCCLAGIKSRAQSNASEEIAHRIADRMRDSLQLSSQQRDQIYTINLGLHQRKDSARSQQSEIHLLRPVLQAIERSRDTLYMPVLGEVKYQLYRQKRGTLVR